MESEEFIEMIGPTCGKICPVYNLPASVCIAQAIIESGWGEYVIGNYNYWGRKYNGWGEYVVKTTQEYYNGQWILTDDSFQSYSSLDEAVEDWCQLMREEPAYKQAVDIWDSCFELEPFVKAMASVYATDPDYADKILDTIKANDLTKYDAWF